MRDIFKGANAFIAAQQSAGNAKVDLDAFMQAIRSDGRECGYQDLPDDDEVTCAEKYTARMVFMNFLAGMLEKPLAEARRYTTAQIEFADMEISIAASRPGGVTPLSEHEKIRQMCARIGWDPFNMSLSEFVGTLIHASRQR